LSQKSHHATKNLMERFNKFNIVHVPREQNNQADIFSKLATILLSKIPLKRQVETMMMK